MPVHCRTGSDIQTMGLSPRALEPHGRDLTPRAARPTDRHPRRGAPAARTPPARRQEQDRVADAEADGVEAADVEQQAAEHARAGGRGEQANRAPAANSTTPRRITSADDLAAPRAEREADAELAPPLADGVGDHAVDADARQQQRDRTRTTPSSAVCSQRCAERAIDDRLERARVVDRLLRIDRADRAGQRRRRSPTDRCASGRPAPCDPASAARTESRSAAARPRRADRGGCGRRRRRSSSRA